MQTSLDRTRTRLPLAVIALAAGVAVTLAAQFVMDGLADQGELFHWLQHGLLFAGGLLAGGALVQLRARGLR